MDQESLEELRARLRAYADRTRVEAVERAALVEDLEPDTLILLGRVADE